MRNDSFYPDRSDRPAFVCVKPCLPGGSVRSELSLPFVTKSGVSHVTTIPQLFIVTKYVCVCEIQKAVIVFSFRFLYFPILCTPFSPILFKNALFSLVYVYLSIGLHKNKKIIDVIRESAGLKNVQKCLCVVMSL